MPGVFLLLVITASILIGSPMRPTRPAWQSIETAPKDGSMFLCWITAERWTSLDESGSGRGGDVSTHDFCYWRELNGVAFFENAMGQIGDTQDITHWMPLPAPPGGN